MGFVMGYVFLPVFRDLNITSTYEVGFVWYSSVFVMISQVNITKSTLTWIVTLLVYQIEY